MRGEAWLTAVLMCWGRQWLLAWLGSTHPLRENGDCKSLLWVITGIQGWTFLVVVSSCSHPHDKRGRTFLSMENYAGHMPLQSPEINTNEDLWRDYRPTCSVNPDTSLVPSTYTLFCVKRLFKMEVFQRLTQNLGSWKLIFVFTDCVLWSLITPSKLLICWYSGS